MAFGPRLLGEGITQISDMYFQIALTSEHVAGFGRVSFGERGEQLTKKERKKKNKESVVKHKSADNYVGRPKN